MYIPSQMLVGSGLLYWYTFKNHSSATQLGPGPQPPNKMDKCARMVVRWCLPPGVQLFLVGGYTYPSEKSWSSSVGMMTFPRYRTIKFMFRNTKPWTVGMTFPTEWTVIKFHGSKPPISFCLFVGTASTFQWYHPSALPNCRTPGFFWALRTPKALRERRQSITQGEATA